jgi:hypothetical protein
VAGHLNLFCEGSQFGVHPRCVQTVIRAYIDSSVRTIQMPNLSFQRSSTSPTE